MFGYMVSLPVVNLGHQVSLKDKEMQTGPHKEISNIEIYGPCEEDNIKWLYTISNVH